MHRILCLISFTFLVISGLFAQKNRLKDLEIGIQYGRGFVLPEYDFINLLTEKASSNFEFQIQKNSIGKNEWERLYNYPSYGIRFLYTDLGSPDALGQLWAIYPYFQIPILNKGAFQIDNQTGLGYSRVNKKFNLEDNYLNVAVGSYGNIHFNTRINLSYQLLDKLRLRSSLSFDHFSNANTAEPNLGINYLSWLGGISYSIGSTNERIEGDLFPKDQEVERELVFSIGGKHSRALDSKYYLTNSLSFEMRKKYYRAFHLGVGADLFYDSSVEEQLKKKEEAFQNSDQFQSGIHISQTFVYNRFSITLQEGFYFLLKEQVEGYPIYCRGIMKYRITENLTTRISMKSHLHILDYPEIGIGWIF